MLSSVAANDVVLPRPWLLCAALGLAAAAAVGCGNPVVDDQIALLGEENPNVPEGEHHRPGQPCVLCHSEGEGAEPIMSVAGTIFAYREEKLPAAGVEVVITDSIGEQYRAYTNCIGNFYLVKEDADPLYPLAVSINFPDYDLQGTPALDATTGEVLLSKSQTMSSWIYRDGSCAGCHKGGGVDLDSAGWVYCVGGVPGERPLFPPIAPDCPGEI